MNWLPLSWFRRTAPKSHLKLAAQRPRSARLVLEMLEDRTVPTLFTVVPAALPVDGTHFHDLASAIAAAGTLGDTIQIDPGSVPGAGNTGNKVLTFQGNPNNSPVSLPQVGVLTLQSSGNLLTNINLSSVAIANGATGQIIQNSIAVNISEINGPLLNGSNIISSNTITNSVIMGSGGNSFPGAINDVIKNNVFINNQGSVILLDVTHDNGAIITGNTLTDTAGDVRAIQVQESTGVLVANNVIIVTGIGDQGIEIDNPEFDVTVSVNNNRIDTGGVGTGIITHKTAGHALSVSVSGNDLVLNNIGVDVEGDGSDVGTVDLGAGVLSSRGGNDFHSFVTTVGGRAAILTGNGGGTVTADLNIFSAINPSTVVVVGGAAVSLGSQLTPDQGFIQTLYNAYLHRSGELSELNAWISVLPSLGQGGVASGIIHSREAASRLVERYYVKFLGREATAAEVTSGANLIVGGATAEDVAASILATPEFLAHSINVAPTPSDANNSFVQALYVLLLNRNPDPSEVNGWVSALPSLGQLGVANGFLHSPEFRTYVVLSLYYTDPALGTWSYMDSVPNMLHRFQLPAPGEVPAWVNGPYDILNIETTIAASGEFYAIG